MYVYRLLGILIASLLTISTHAFAGISLDNTRIIFTGTNEQRGQSIGVTSSSSSSEPYLVKAQILEDISGNNLETPFTVTPSIFRLEPGSTNQLRILKIENRKLDQDKESIFYLRVIAMPAGKSNNSQKESELGGNIKISTGSIIKLIYRPDGLKPSLTESMGGLQVTKIGNTLKIKNPSPYFITLASLSVGNKNIPISVIKQNTTILPFGGMTYNNINLESKKISWQAINDYGGLEKFNTEIK